MINPLNIRPGKLVAIRKRSAILICGLSLAGGSLYLLRQFQVSRLARSVDEQAADALKAGDFGKAAALYAEHVAVLPDDMEAQSNYADSLLKGSPTPRQQALALKIFDKILEQYPGRDDLRRRRAELRFAVGNLSEADTQAELQILLDSPQGKRDGHLLFLLGRCCEANNNDARAKFCYEAAIENHAPRRSRLVNGWRRYSVSPAGSTIATRLIGSSRRWSGRLPRTTGFTWHAAVTAASSACRACRPTWKRR